MNFGLTEKQIELRAKVRDFAEKEVKPVAAFNDEHEKFDVELTKKMGQLGLLGMCVPQEYGGQGLDTLSYIIAVEESRFSIRHIFSPPPLWLSNPHQDQNTQGQKHPRNAPP